MSNCEKKHDHKYYCDDFCEKKYDNKDRFSGVSGPEIRVSGGHVHQVKARVDFSDHYHEFTATSSLQIPVGEGNHAHFVETTTSINDGHSHELMFVTLIDVSIFEEED